MFSRWMGLLFSHRCGVITAYVALHMEILRKSYYMYDVLKKNKKNGEVLIFKYKIYTNTIIYRICRNKRPGRLIFRSNKTNFKTHQKPSVLCTPLFEETTHQSPSVSCTPPFEKSPIKAHRFCVLPPLKNHCFWWALILANSVDQVRYT